MISREHTRQSLFRHGAWVLALLSAGYMLWSLRYFLEDDTFIPFRYAMHVVQGYGIVWNIGERVEGYTSFLMVMLLALGEWLSIPLLSTARGIGVTSLLTLSLILVLYARKEAGTPAGKRFFPAVTFIAIILSIPLLYWAQSGMETVLFACLLTAGVITTLRAGEARTAPSLWPGLWFGLAVLTRPEAYLFAGIAFGFLGLQRHRRKHLTALVIFVAIASAHLLWRYHYYEEWLPNTYYAKLGMEMSAARLSAGLEYVSSFFFKPPFWGIMGGVGCLLGWHRRALRHGQAMLLLMVSAYLLYVVRTGGDWMPEQRFLVPVIPLCLLLMMRAVISHESAITAWPHYRWSLWVALIFFALPLLRLNAVPYPKFVLFFYAIGEHIHQCWPKDSLVAINMAGIIPHTAPEMRYLDMLGLNDRTIAHRTIPPAKGYMTPGHEKGDGPYVLSRKPDYIIVGDGISDNMIGTSAYLSEREMAEDPMFHQLYRREERIVPVNHPDLSTTEVTFSYYKRVDSSPSLCEPKDEEPFR